MSASLTDGVALFQENLVELLEECAEILEKAERYELLGELYRLIIPIYERRRAFVVRMCTQSTRKWVCACETEI